MVSWDLNIDESIKMGVGFKTFLTCILFNVLLPSGDIGSDLDLMYRALTFDLGTSLELEGCKSCYHKTKNEVYYPEIGFTTNHCKTCVYDPRLVCGRFVPALLKVREYED